MRGESTWPARHMGPDEFHYGGSFAVNGADDPVADDNRVDLGFSFSVVHSGTGEYTVTVGDNFILPNAYPFVVLVSAQPGTSGTLFDAYAVGEVDLGTPGALTFTIVTAQSGSAADIDAAAGARVNFAFFAQNNTGK